MTISPSNRRSNALIRSYRSESQLRLQLDSTELLWMNEGRWYSHRRSPGTGPGFSGSGAASRLVWRFWRRPALWLVSSDSRRRQIGSLRPELPSNSKIHHEINQMNRFRVPHCRHHHPHHRSFFDVILIHWSWRRSGSFSTIDRDLKSSIPSIHPLGDDDDGSEWLNLHRDSPAAFRGGCIWPCWTRIRAGSKWMARSVVPKDI